MHASFSFSGTIPPSKSLLIRHLLLTLYEPQITLPLSSGCADVAAMKGACESFLAARGRPDWELQNIHCGEAGLVLRLCLGYASRHSGSYLLTGSRRLIERPHEPLLSALRQLGTDVVEAGDLSTAGLRVHSRGWQQVSSPLSLMGGLSSQFASSLLLNAWNLPFPLEIQCDPEPVSEGYLEMSVDVARHFGMAVEQHKESDHMTLIIPAHQRIHAGMAAAEADVSSAFAVAAIAAVSGTAHILNFPVQSLQPDHCFVGTLKRMGTPIELSMQGLSVRQAPHLLPVEVDVGGAPDLTPVLAVLAALASGRSLLFGAPQLRGKESDRIATTSALLTVLGRRHTPRHDGIEIFGSPLSEQERARPVRFDATGDHRLVMAAAVARWAGFPIEIQGLSAVNKSFPEFLEIAQLSPIATAVPAKEAH